MKIRTFTSYDNVEMVEIDNEDGSFTSMTKATYEAQQVEHLTEIPTKGASKATLASELVDPAPSEKPKK